MTTCLIYRSEKRKETYLFLRVGMPFQDLPEDLRQVFGEPRLVMRLDMDGNTKLAQAEPARVLSALEEEGYYLQLPPKVSVENLLSRKFS